LPAPIKGRIHAPGQGLIVRVFYNKLPVNYGNADQRGCAPIILDISALIGVASTV
jgi:hypothetical protein